MEFLQNLFESSQMPLVSAFILGLMTAISPCPLATNITAIGFISKDINSRQRVFINGLVYTLGRAISYTSVGAIFFFSTRELQFSGPLQEWGEKLLGPLLIFIGFVMLDLLRFNIPGFSGIQTWLEQKSKKGFWGALLLGIAFALAFCPYSGVLYFGMLMPLTLSSSSGLLLPFVFAIATGIPVILFAWFLAFSAQKVGGMYNNIKAFELWFRRIVAIVFIAVGIYQTISIFFPGLLV